MAMNAIEYFEKRKKGRESLKRKVCPRRGSVRPLGLALTAAGAFILAVMFLPPIVWVFLTAVALIGGGIAVITKR
jgi:hypothetical protein